jgi:sugar phosphate isomerase/epimerase
MKVGYQTISWGWGLADHGERMLRIIAEAGYSGVELAQHPDEFGSPRKLYEMLSDPDVNLRLLGLAGGSIQDRADFLSKLVDLEMTEFSKGEVSSDKFVQFDRDHPYVYVDSWDEYDAGLVLAKCCVALHPHMFKPIQTAREAYELLKKHPDLRFLPDTAHLTVAGENVLQVLKDSFALRVAAEDAQNGSGPKFGPVIGVHLKDWTSEFGRSYQFYSRGFGVRFGEGEVELEKIVRFLRSEAYNGWVVVEQDVAEDPVGATHACRRWLRARGV